MRRKLKNLKNKSGHSENGAPRSIIELAVYREHRNRLHSTEGATTWDPAFSGWSNPSRPRDSAISLRAIITTVVPPPPPP
jgi:hypothetical protein